MEHNSGTLIVWTHFKWVWSKQPKEKWPTFYEHISMSIPLDSKFLFWVPLADQQQCYPNRSSLPIYMAATLSRDTRPRVTNALPARGPVLAHCLPIMSLHFPVHSPSVRALASFR